MWRRRDSRRLGGPQEAHLDPVVGGHPRVLESWGQMAAAEMGGTKERMGGWGGENERSRGCWPELTLHSRLGDGAIPKMGMTGEGRRCRKSEPGLARVLDVTNLHVHIGSSAGRFRGASREPVITNQAQGSLPPAAH